ncbi:MAG: YbjQ family protein [Sphingomonadales bacterium]|nr:YbjQ family protein [Sphingomonadales bacterium]
MNELIDFFKTAPWGEMLQAYWVNDAPWLDWLLFTAAPFVVLWAVARILARRHELRLRRKEAGPRLLVSTDKSLPGEATASQLVSASVVVSHAVIRRFPVIFRRIIGGEIPVLGRVLARARRDALLRLEGQARRAGCNAIYNLRMATTGIGGSEDDAMKFEILAYGTAVALADRTEGS